MPSLNLKPVDPDVITAQSRRPVDREALQVAGDIVEDVRTNGREAVLRHAQRLGDLNSEEPLRLDREVLERALATIDPLDRAVLERTTQRIRTFAEAQLGCLSPLDLAIEGGRAGHRWLPVRNAGCYAPGGRYPLPSSVLMTVIPARTAGVQSVWVASPRPSAITLAAAAIAGADGLLACGGAQAIAALTFGIDCPPADMVSGAGNRYVTAAKKYLMGEVGIDALAGPSELLIIADAAACPRLIAVDLLAQAEHDVEANVILVTPSAFLVEQVECEITAQLGTLSTAATAREALRRQGYVVLTRDLNHAIEVSDALAPEHLELCVEDSQTLADKARNYGGLFIGAGSAEVFGDYGAGPNHVLPTGRSARFQAGLSVFTYLRPSTYLGLQPIRQVCEDTARLARMEGLEGHARAAEFRSNEGWLAES